MLNRKDESLIDWGRVCHRMQGVNKGDRTEVFQVFPNIGSREIGR